MAVNRGLTILGVAAICILLLLISLKSSQNGDDSNATVKYPELLGTQQQYQQQQQHQQQQQPRQEQSVLNSGSGRRHIFLDCGANIASTVELFRTTYPDNEKFEIISFELDDRLAPYFASYGHHKLHCPAAVADKDGEIETFAESPWSPHKGKNNNKDMQWGGGSLFAFGNEKDSKDGGLRKLNYRKKILAIDLAEWMRTNLKKEDYVIFKLDVEGAEFRILRKMLDLDVFDLVDKFYGEFHMGDPHGLPRTYLNTIVADLKSRGIKMIDWGAETAQYADIMELNKPVAISSIGKPGEIYKNCIDGSATLDGRKPLFVGVAVGNNFRLARRIIETIIKYKDAKLQKKEIDPPIGLFFYGQFLDEYPEDVKRWSQHFEIGSRGERHFLPGVYDTLRPNLRRKSLIYSRRLFEKHGFPTASYLTQMETAKEGKDLSNTMKALGLHLIKPTVQFPPLNLASLGDNYQKVRSVERNPKALRYIHQQLKDHGGTLILDSDFDDSFQIIAFLLDWLTDYEESNKVYELLPLSKCLTRNRS